MSTGDSRPDEIIKLLTELTDLVKALGPKVENHTHHHYPTNPQYYYPNQWTYGTGNSGSWNSGSSMVGSPPPGSTTTWSTNDTTPPK